jgi:hypothetical protein
VQALTDINMRRWIFPVGGGLSADGSLSVGGSVIDGGSSSTSGNTVGCNFGLRPPTAMVPTGFVGLQEL